LTTSNETASHQQTEYFDDRRKIRAKHAKTITTCSQRNKLLELQMTYTACC